MRIKVKGQPAERIARLRRSESENIEFRVAAGTDNTVDVYLYDVIGWPFIEAQDLLYRVPKNAASIHVHINSPGGDVFEGMAIYNYLVSHQAPVRISVDALAASSGSLVAMAGEQIEMKPASFLMIHNPYTLMQGGAEELRKEADLLDKISNVFADSYNEVAGKTRNEVLELMKAETWFTAQEAVDAGFAHAISGRGEQGGGDSGKAAMIPPAMFDLSVFENVPQALRQGSSGTPRQAGADKQKPKKGVITMPKELRALLEKLGLSKDATEQQAWAYLAEDVKPEEIETREDREAVQAALAARDTPPSREDLEAAAREAAKAERKRAADIREAVSIANLDPAFADDLINKEASVDAARTKIFAKMKETNPPIGIGRFQVAEDEQDKFRSAVTHGIAMRAGLRIEQPAAGHEQFRSASIEFVARQCLERAGVSTAGMGSRDQIAREILKRSASGSYSTDDFSSIFLDVAEKTLMRAFQEAPATWRPFVNVVPASDFKTIYGVSLSEAPDLELVDADGEYKSSKMSDKQESYSVATYGKIVYLTRQMIVNDDLRAFTRLPRLLGTAARRKESDLVWALITSNPAMQDGTTLFHADHNNLEAAAGNKGAVDTDKLSAARAAMRKQKGLEGAILDLQPRFLLVPVEQETSAEVILRSTALPQADQSSGVYNPWANRLTPIAEPRLDADSTKAWYTVADPAQVDTIEVAYLDGNEAPYTEEEPLFVRDAVGYKIRHDFGCGVMDHRGFFKNPGE
jgi:ATP-dependent protease ClpP protease subunit/phage major head subunit gpT-like protein